MDFIFNNEPVKTIFSDEPANKEIIFFTREPTSDERIKYASALASLFRDKGMTEVAIEDISKIQFQYGLEMLTGFILLNIPVNISSDPESPQYDPDWKRKIGNRAPDLIILLCRQIFESGGFSPRKN